MNGKRFITFIFVILCYNAFSQKETMQTAFIYQFTKYLNWPEEDKSGDFVIGMLGEGNIENNLNELAKTKKVVNQTIVFKKFNQASSITKCHILLITNSKKALLTNVLSNVASQSTLVIGENETMAANGAGIALIERSGKIVFEINKKAIENCGISINSQLISLASKVY